MNIVHGSKRKDGNIHGKSLLISVDRGRKSRNDELLMNSVLHKNYII